MRDSYFLDYHVPMDLVALNTHTSRYQVTGHLELQGERLLWQAQVKTQEALWVEASFTSDYRRNWTLWERDVVELFFQRRQHPQDFLAPYLELQLSPLNQPFALMILKPRISFYTPLTLKLESSVHTHSWGFESHLEVELPSELQLGECWAGMFAALGKNPREFHALSPWAQGIPDFHQPQYFQRFR
jgi:hypothetical protein